ncbi:uncharacterized protein ACWYII_044344 [Salvelinus alpinus]
MFSSKSEPDISKIAQSKEDFIVFSGSPNGQSPRRRTDHEATARPQLTGSRHSTPIPALGSLLQQEAIDVLPISQLPVSSSKGQQPLASSSSSASAPRTPTTTTNCNANRIEPSSSSKTRQAPTRHNNNNDENNQQHKEIWILHRDLHENNNHTKY